MDTVKLMILYWAMMLAGYFIASRLRSKAEKFGFLDHVMTAIIAALVFIMGLEMGSDSKVTSSLGTIGLQSVLVTVMTVGGSMLLVTLGRKIFRLDRFGLPAKTACMTEATKTACMTQATGTAGMTEATGTAGTAEATEEGLHAAGSAAEGFSGEGCSAAKGLSGAAGSPAGGFSEEVPREEEKKVSGDLMTTLLILGFVAAGMVCGYFLLPRFAGGEGAMDAFREICGSLLTAGVCMILGIVGFTMGLTGEITEHLKHVGIKVIVIPLLAVAGSLAGGALYGVLSSLTVRESMAVSAGFGWYTLAPGLITEAGHTVAGAVSFMHNVMREVLGIIGVPMFARVFGYLECTAVPGVCAMDICLPIVERSTRSDIIVYSFMTGLFMCITVPVLVPILMA